MPVPFLGRLNGTEYIALVGSFLLVGLEALVRVFTLALPPSLLELFYGISRRLFNRLTTPAQKRAEQRRKSISTSIRNASDFVDLCATFGYTAEEHVVQTKDGYLLGLHRLAWRKGEEDTRVNRGPKSIKKRVLYLHHGLLMNSEVWVCLTDEQRALPFVLVEKGFDVWFGNNRGNKYSRKSIHSSPTSLQFWNFSIDEFAFHDIPDSISYILETTGQESLSYIGFSQGTAQAFASLAVHPKLNDQVNVFIALAPAMSPAGLSNGIVDALVKASPQVLFLLFGRRSILSSTTMWESILYPPIFTKVIDLGLSFLFNWRTENISTSQKLAAYPHLYSFTSTKSVVHWFQIIRTKSFQMYDDELGPPTLLTSSTKYTKVAKYPTRNIRTPIVLVYGGSDSLVDIKAMLRELPPQTVANEVPHYEHLDFLWARDVDKHVFQHVFDALESFTGAEHSREQYRRYRIARQSSSLKMGLLGKKRQAAAGGQPGGGDVLESDVSTAVGGGSTHDDEDVREEKDRGNEESEESEAATARPAATPRLGTKLGHPPHPSGESRTRSPTGGPAGGAARPPGSSRAGPEGGGPGAAGDMDSPTLPRPTTPSQNMPRFGDVAPSSTSTEGGAAAEQQEAGAATSPVSPSRPGGGGGMPALRKRSSAASQMSFDSARGGRGINIGASKAVGGVTTSNAEIAGLRGIGAALGRAVGEMRGSQRRGGPSK